MSSMSTPLILLVPQSSQFTFFQTGIWNEHRLLTRLIHRGHNDTSAMSIVFISSASSMLVDDDSYHSQSCVEVWNFLRLYGFSALCAKSKWYLSIFNPTNLIRVECDKCIRAPKVIAEIWALAGTIQMISVQSHKPHSFYSLLPDRSSSNPFINIMRKPHWGFCPIFLSLRSSLPFLFFCCILKKNTWNKYVLFHQKL